MVSNNCLWEIDSITVLLDFKTILVMATKLQLKATGAMGGNMEASTMGKTNRASELLTELV